MVSSTINWITMKRSAEEWIKYVEDRSVPSNHLLHNMFKCWMQLLRIEFNEADIDRLLQSIIDWIKQYVSRDLLKFREGETIDIDLYHCIRRINIGLYSYTINIEIFNKLDMNSIRSDEQISDCYNKLLDIIGYNILYVNDLYSFKKEVKQNDHKLNIVFLKMKNYSIDAEKAKVITIEKINEFLNNFEDMKIKMKKYNINGFDNYIDSIHQLIHGNILWSYTGARYN